MKKIYTFFLSLGLISGVLAQDDKVFVKDNNAIERPVSSFTGIVINGGFDLYLSQSEGPETLVVSAVNAAARDQISTEVTNGVLVISYKSKFSKGDKKLKVYVSFRNLDKITASGSTDIYVNGVLKADVLNISLSGASDFTAAIDVSRFNLVQSGSSDSKLSGRAGKASINVSGASDVSAYDLETDYCTALASGASDIQITVNKELVATASGSSDINYKGTGSIMDIKRSGSSSVNKKN